MDVIIRLDLKYTDPAFVADIMYAPEVMHRLAVLACAGTGPERASQQLTSGADGARSHRTGRSEAVMSKHDTCQMYSIIIKLYRRGHLSRLLPEDTDATDWQVHVAGA